ncbi:MAG: glucose-6-phosphate 1-dehydrogenase [Pyrinomonadaceae bacterium]|jgi:glucose-6-phosphate 1-dehydrogenase|nr:glucose-6-phosphate 1-dehydrogenase [Pyrinomonadaceae bacterium]
MDTTTSSNENPLRAGMRLERVAPPCVVVIFGATGDLTRRKLLPALYRLTEQRLIPAEFAILGTARQTMSDDEFRAHMQAAIKEFAADENFDELTWQSFAKRLFYIAGEFNDVELYTKLKSKLEEVDAECNTRGNRLFYLATAPDNFGLIAGQLGQAELARPKEGSWTRIIVEKPFGHDLESARALNQELAEVFEEKQIYRIDHYLGKETVQNLLVFRFANSIFEPLWNRQYIDHIQITNAEGIGVEGRGGYYEKAGALRDMIQNHVFQVTSLIAMEPPASLSANGVRDEKIKAMQSVRPLPAEQIEKFTVRGQYGPGTVLGDTVPGYRQEPGVDPNSSTETFAALRLHFDNWRWAGVPFYLRSGKRLQKHITEIAIQFKDVPHRLFTDADAPLQPNVLVIRIQPNEGITLRFGAKLPGQAMRIRSVNMDFRYGSSFGVKPPEAYERLLLDCMLGDSTLYARRDMVERGWEIVSPIIAAWQQPATDFPNYEAGSWGPQAAFEMIERDGRKWRRL